MSKTRVAVVSKDGVNVDEHFGKADHFLIYDITEKPAFVEKRMTESLSTGDPNHSFDPDKFGRVSSIIHDCAKVFITKIGEVPAAKLKEMGIEPIVYSGAISDIII